MLKGSELLAKIKELGDADRVSVLRACGYVSTKKDGSERLNFTAFYEAIIDAKGVTLAPPATKAREAKRGKAPSYKATVSKGGMVPVGAAYISEAGFGPGDTLGFIVSPGTITIERVAVAPSPTTTEAAPVVITPATEPAAIPAAATPAVVTYDSVPAPAVERELAPF